MPVSKQEQLLFNVIRVNYKPKRIIQSYRPNFLKNEKTGNNLEIDIYLPAHRIGFEFQGAVHFERIEKYNNDPDKSRNNDIAKLSMVDSTFTKWVTIVEIFEQDLVGDIYANIMQRCRNTQEYYFDKKYFKKCYIIEEFLQFQETCFHRYSVRWFDLLDKIIHFRVHGYHNNLHAINNLLSFYFDPNVGLPDKRIFNIDEAARLLGFEKNLYRRRQKISG